MDRTSTTSSSEQTYNSSKLYHDLHTADYVAKKPALTKPQYIARVKQVMQRRKAQQKAANIARGFRAVCKEVAAKKGAAARG